MIPLTHIFQKNGLQIIKNVLGDAKPDYLIIQHMEPDHSSSIGIFMEHYPDTTIVASAKAFTIMKQFFGCDYAEHQLVVKEKDTLELGKHTLTFVAAPMVHWPEVIMTYDPMQKYSSAQMHLENSVHWMLRKTGLAKQDAIISELLENTVLRCRRFLRRLPVLISRPSATPRTSTERKSGLLSEPVSDNGLLMSEDKRRAHCYTSVYGNTKKAD